LALLEETGISLVRQLAAIVNGLPEEFAVPIFLNADHTPSLARDLGALQPLS
jgi:fructose/tagatose bisphosphate aldolase